MKQLTEALGAGSDLDPGQVESAAAALLDEAVPVAEKAAFLKALSAKGETPSEIAAFVQAFLGRAVDPGLREGDVDGPMLDVCGTGGDKLNMFNVSTTGIFVLAAGGVFVVKHGNRGITSKSGGADVLEALGVPIDLPPAEFAESVKRIGLGFLFAPQYHPAFKAVVPVRKQLAEEGVRTIFNLIGPLLNPVRPKHQVVGVFDRGLTGAFADILGALGRTRAWAVHGSDGAEGGMDEVSTLGPTAVSEIHDGQRTDFEINPAELGIRPPMMRELIGGTAVENAEILVGILEGSLTGPPREIVALNAAAGFVVAGVTETLADGYALANRVIGDGSALGKLRESQT